MSSAKRAFVPSELQKAFFEFVQYGNGNCNLVAVAGSGKSTTCIRTIPLYPSHLKVKMLSFGNRIVKDLKAKVVELEAELGRKFPNVFVSTFHSVGFSALRSYFKSKGLRGELNDHKLRNLLRSKISEEEMFLYGKFVVDLVGYAKGSGLGIASVAPASDENFYEIIEHHDMMLESEQAKLERAVALARALLAASMKQCRDEGIYDFDDMLYMPLYLDLRFWQEDIIIVDEAQDMNRVRREIVRKMMKRTTRVFFVGDPKQAIFGFTGATNDAMEVIKQEFDCIELMLNVSYRCPKRIVSKVKALVPYFEVYEGNKDGDEFDVKLDEMLPIVTDRDAILCRNVAPMVSLAFKLIGRGRACHVLGSEIGKGIITLIKRMDAQHIDHLKGLIEQWRDREMEALLAKGKEDKAAGVADKAECVFVLIENLPEAMRTIDGLIARVESLFQDEDRTLCLSSIHKAKGREWENVVIYCPERLPSPWARKPWMREQESNLEYVAYTRAMNYTMYLPEVV
jgi:DNA helicase-2/ATP-dependent DNA helicase PcrA